MSLLDNLPPEARPNCAECPFSDQGKPRHKPVMGTCIKGPKGVLVGEGPGPEEVARDEVFVGRTGEWLNARLAESGLVREDMAIINATGCLPPRGMKTDSNLHAAAKACLPLFQHQYHQYRGLPTLAMGKWAGHAAMNGRTVSIETGRGFLRGNLILTWHPTYAAFYNPWKAGEFVNDLQRFKRLLDGSLEQAPKTLIRPTVANIAGLARGAKFLAVDIETRAPHGQPAHLGKDPLRAELRTIALGNTKKGIAYWWGSDLPVQNAIVAVLHDPNIVKVFHNGYFFDLRVLRRYGVIPTLVLDTRDMRRAVSATSRLSLRYLASLYSDFAPWKETEDDK